MAESTSTHHVFLIPGLFGFATLAGYDYFQHLESAIGDRFRQAAVPLRIERVPSLPTSSIASRADVLAASIIRSPPGGPIHLVGHSSGGLDARLLMSPSTSLPGNRVPEVLRARVRTVVGINTPHFGTPLAAYFSTVSGTRLLYVISLFTVAGLSIGRLPLSMLERLVSVVKAADGLLGLDIQLIDDLTDQVLNVVGVRGRKEIGEFMRRLMTDQAGIIQLMPEVSELFNAAVEDQPGTRYGCIATAAPGPGPRRFLRAVISPVRALQLGVYTTVYGVTSRASARFPYATPTPQQNIVLSNGFDHPITPDNVDGIVPTLSMLWGELIWCGAADHLDVVGHFEDDRKPPAHVDWLHSGARFRRADFLNMVDSLCAFLLR
jgi:triacylglycerol esterase/lipase EstA (alpha/beta hydrolase family)